MKSLALYLNDNNEVYLYKGNSYYKLAYYFTNMKPIIDLFNRENWIQITRNSKCYLNYIIPKVDNSKIDTNSLDIVRIDLTTMTFRIDNVFKLYRNLIIDNYSYRSFDSYRHIFIGKDDMKEIILEAEIPKVKFDIIIPNGYFNSEVYLHFNPDISKSFIMSDEELYIHK